MRLDFVVVSDLSRPTNPTIAGRSGQTMIKLVAPERWSADRHTLYQSTSRSKLGNARAVINEVALRCMRTLVPEPDKYLTSSNRPLDR